MKAMAGNEKEERFRWRGML